MQKLGLTVVKVNNGQCDHLAGAVEHQPRHPNNQNDSTANENFFVHIELESSEMSQTVIQPSRRGLMKKAAHKMSQTSANISKALKPSPARRSVNRRRNLFSLDGFTGYGLLLRLRCTFWL
jgi:hypothetical protein